MEGKAKDREKTGRRKSVCALEKHRNWMSFSIRQKLRTA